METTPTMLVIIGLLLAAWTAAAAWMMIAAGAKASRADAHRTAARKLGRMIEEAPAIPLLVRVDGRIEAPERLARWLGLDGVPQYFSDLSGGTGKGLSQAQVAELEENVRRTQKTASPFRLALTPPGSNRSLALRGMLADQRISPGGAALVWVFDFSESESELTRLREEAGRAREDFGALVGLIEAAPMPMWFRGPDASLKLVNAAYVRAVDAGSAEDVVRDQIELIEASDGKSAAEIANMAVEEGEPVERIVQATIGRERRTMRVSDFPLGREGVAGYAIDIEELEDQRRAFRAFRDAQRRMLDQLSIGVAQFDGDRRIVFANQPFRRIFALQTGALAGKMEFDRVLNEARERGRLPEVRDFPAWRADHAAWFTSGETQEEAWPLPDGTHLRIVAQPMPDGGLVLIAEDRTEQLKLAAGRDTLLRTRTATFDSLFEALAVFAPDGTIQTWNRSFGPVWGVERDLLDTHPTAEAMLDAIAPGLEKPKQAQKVGEVIRAATLDRKGKGGRVTLADGRTLEFAGVPLPDGNGLLTALDITDSKKAEDALRERNQALEQADDVKTRFLANMSYEFRTPLTSISGFAELLESGVAGELTDQGQEYVAAIIEAVARLSEQVENVLDLSQSEAGLMPIAKESLELLPFVTTLVREREATIVDKGLGLNLRGGKGVALDADPRQLARALGLLVDNAIAATPKGGRIFVDLGKQGEMVRIVVTDTGRGMSEDELAAAMARDDHKKKGLGIPLARELVEAHGGRLELASKKGKGTSVTILLP